MDDLRILLVEIDDEFLRAARAALRSRIPPVVADITSDSGDALGRLARAAYDAVVYASDLPGLDVVAFAERTRAMPSKPEVLLLVRVDDPEVTRRALAAGVRKILKKGFRLDTFLDDLHGALRSLRRGSTPTDQAPAPEPEPLVAEQARRREAEARETPALFLSRVGTLLADSLDLEVTLDQVAQLSVPHLGDWCLVDVLETERSKRHLAVAHPDRFRRRLAERLYRRWATSGGSPLLPAGAGPEMHPHITEAFLRRITDSPRQLNLLRHLRLGSGMLLPMQARGRTLGVIAFFRSAPGEPYGEDDLRVAGELATRAALAIDNARLYRDAQLELAERRRVEQALRESEERFRRLAENAADLIYRHRVAPLPSYEYVSPSASAITGYTPEEHYADPELGLKIVHPSDRPAAEKILMAGEAPSQPLLLRCRRKDGREVWMEQRCVAVRDASGKVVAVEGIARDVTERERGQRCQKAIYEVTRILAEAGSLADAIPSLLRALSECVEWDAGGLWLVDPKAALLRCHETWHDPARAFPRFEATSLNLPLARGVGLPGRVWASGRPAFIADVREDPNFPRAPVARAEGLQAGLAAPILFGDEVLGVLEFFSTIPHPPDAVLLNLLSSIGSQIGQFIRRKQAEEDVRLLNETLERRVEERTAELEGALRDMGAFAYTLAHDLRAPLRALAGFSQALLEDYGAKLDPTGRDYAARIAEASRRMDALLQDLLVYVRITRTEVTVHPVNLGSVVDETLEEKSREISERRAVVTVERPIPPVVGHRVTLKLVVSNLLTNAVKFVAQGVTPRVRLAPERRRGPSAGKGSGRVRLWVEDNGIGIAPEYRDRIFGVFERLHRTEEYPGTGMGLAIVRKGMERMGGAAGVESEPGRGSRFWIELPAA